MSLLPRLIVLTLGLATALPALAQEGGPFAPRVQVNGRAVTNWEYDQRIRMLTLFGAPGDLEAEAKKVLIDERLQLGAAEALGLTVTPEGIQAGMEEFAARANLSAEEFIAALAQGGVAEETFRDFVEAGSIWREVVRARFGPRAQVTEAEIDRAVATTTEARSVRLQLSEIVIPVGAGGPAAAITQANRLRRTIQTEDDFAAAAREFSAAPTAGRGGRLDALTPGTLPPEVATAIRGLRPGQISAPVTVEGAVAIFQLRAIEDVGVQEATTTSVEYARLAIPANRDPGTEATRIRDLVDTCDDLYGVAKGLPAEALVRETLPAGEVPSDITLALALLDDNETTLISRGGRPEFLMLCGRVPLFADAPSRDAIRADLLNRRLSSYANGYLEELRADAIIREF